MLFFDFLSEKAINYPKKMRFQLSGSFGEASAGVSGLGMWST